MELSDEIKNRCEWCDNHINFNYLTAITSENKLIVFCDIVCAKIYHDNCVNIKIKNNTYTNAYIAGTLKERDKKMYEKTEELLFQNLPIMKYNKDLITKKEFKVKCDRLIFTGL